MPQITNTELKAQLDALKVQVGKVETRMDSIEQQWRSAMPILQRVDGFFDFLHNFLGFLKKCAWFVMAAVMTELIAWFIFHLLGH